MLNRALQVVVDHEPKNSQITELWDFFSYECAYCGKKLRKGKKEAHIDHLVPTSRNGLNHISNRVLSCAKCNENEKKEMTWKKFLRKKNKYDEDFNKRMKMINRWKNKNKKTIPNRLYNFKIIAKKEANEVSKNIDKKVEKLRQLK